MPERNVSSAAAAAAASRRRGRRRGAETRAPRVATSFALRWPCVALVLDTTQPAASSGSHLGAAARQRWRRPARGRCDRKGLGLYRSSCGNNDALDPGAARRSTAAGLFWVCEGHGGWRRPRCWTQLQEQRPRRGLRHGRGTRLVRLLSPFFDICSEGGRALAFLHVPPQVLPCVPGVLRSGSPLAKRAAQPALKLGNFLERPWKDARPPISIATREGARAAGLRFCLFQGRGARVGEVSWRKRDISRSRGDARSRWTLLRARR